MVDTRVFFSHQTCARALSGNSKANASLATSQLGRGSLKAVIQFPRKRGSYKRPACPHPHNNFRLTVLYHNVSYCRDQIPRPMHRSPFSRSLLTYVQKLYNVSLRILIPRNRSLRVDKKSTQRVRSFFLHVPSSKLCSDFIALFYMLAMSHIEPKKNNVIAPLIREKW